MASGFLHRARPLRAFSTSRRGIEFYTSLDPFLRAPDAFPAIRYKEVGMSFLVRFRGAKSAMVGGAALALVPLSAHAAAIDFSGLTGSIDFASVSTAVLAIAAALAVAYISIRGARMVLSMIRG